jgi:Arc/MetJ family transcription regulator
MSSAGENEGVHLHVYAGVVSRTNIDIDDELVARAMRTFGLRSKREAVHLALERLVGEGPMSVDEQLDMEGVGWEGDLDEMRADRTAGWGADAPR